MKDITKIIKKLKENKQNLKKEHSIKKLGVFGSYVRGEAKKGSDLDILIEFERPVGLLEYMEIERKLSKLSGKKVDLVMKTALKPRIGEQIHKEVLYV